ncbi:ATP-binding cassette domain-containing protein [Streptomyces sp. NPDC059161]|uniref:ATP-binding cassette domain-containing protein n=1 Tax=Streptomyces sp. NPDC059161 TaxID=3346749 RepID=UPI0036BCD19A
MAGAVVVEDLHESYGVVRGAVRAVDGASFGVERGQIFALLGRNGAGKTTTVETVGGGRTQDGGRVDVLGLDPVDRSTARPARGDRTGAPGHRGRAPCHCPRDHRPQRGP